MLLSSKDHIVAASAIELADPGMTLRLQTLNIAAYNGYDMISPPQLV